jgi:hypothetical protein
MAILAQSIIERAANTLNDVGQVRWTEDELLDAINDAQLAILEGRPDVFETVGEMTLGAGPRQFVPGDCYLLFDVLYNIDDQSIATSGVTRVMRSYMDSCRSDWMRSQPSSEVEHWMQDDRERGTFFVYPPQPSQVGAQGQVLLRYSRFPDLLTAATDELSVTGEMLNAVYYFVVMRMLEKDEKFSGSPQASRFMQLFAQVLAAQTIGEDQHAQFRSAKENV